ACTYEDGASPNAQKGNCMNALVQHTDIYDPDQDATISGITYMSKGLGVRIMAFISEVLENRACRASTIVVQSEDSRRGQTLNLAKVPNNAILLRLSDGA
ncbi:unnamed protein product, partial [Fusarium graminearum]